MLTIDPFEPVLSLGTGAGDCQAEHIRSLAPRWLSTVLALEIPSSRTAAATSESADPYPYHGAREPELGRGTHCGRTVAQARRSRGFPNGRQVHETGRTSSAVGWTAVEHVRTKPCPRNCRLRFLHFGYSNIPGSVRIRRNRDWNTPHVARERDGPSHRGVDAAAVPSLPRWRIRASLFNPRSRHCFLGRGRPGTERLRSESIEDSGAKPDGECLLRTSDRHLRRECLDYLIPLNARHLKRVLSEFATHYNRGRPHTALGPGLPEPVQATIPVSGHRHRLPAGYRVSKTQVVGGLHHEYRLEEDVA